MILKGTSFSPSIFLYYYFFSNIKAVFNNKKKTFLTKITALLFPFEPMKESLLI